MANTYTTQGKQRNGVQFCQATAGSGPTYSASRYVGQSLSVDDSTVAIAAADVAANTGGAITNFYAFAQDATSTAVGTTVTVTGTVPAAQFNGFTIKRILVHDQIVGSVTASSVTAVCGIDGQSIVKNSGFALTLAVTIVVA